MNNNNIKYTFENNTLHAEWGELHLDDKDRDNGILIQVECPSSSIDDRAAKKCIKSMLCNAYDNWIKERNG